MHSTAYENLEGALTFLLEHLCPFSGVLNDLYLVCFSFAYFSAGLKKDLLVKKTNFGYNQQLLVTTLGRVCVCSLAAGITNDSSVCCGIMLAATCEFTGVLGDSISFNLEMLFDDSLFAGVPNSSADLSSGVEMTLDTEVLDSVVGVVAEYT